MTSNEKVGKAGEKIKDSVNIIHWVGLMFISHYLKVAYLMYNLLNRQ